MEEELAFGKGGTVGPETFGRVEIGSQGDSLGGKLPGEGVNSADAEHHAVNAHGVETPGMRLEVFGNRRRGGQTVLHEKDAGTFELTGGLKEVARVGP